MDAFKLQEPLPRPPVGPLKMLQVGTDEQAPTVITDEDLLALCNYETVIMPD